MERWVGTNYFVFLAAKYFYSFTNSTKEVSSIKVAWHSPGTLLTMVHGQDLRIKHDKPSLRRAKQFCVCVSHWNLHQYLVCDYVNRIYPIELEIKDSTDTTRSISCFVLHTWKLTIRVGFYGTVLLRRQRWFQFYHFEYSIYI
jgi:hypothetical protein